MIFHPALRLWTILKHWTVLQRVADPLSSGVTQQVIMVNSTHPFVLFRKNILPPVNKYHHILGPQRG